MSSLREIAFVEFYETSHMGYRIVQPEIRFSFSVCAMLLASKSEDVINHIAEKMKN